MTCRIHSVPVLHTATEYLPVQYTALARDHAKSLNRQLMCYLMQRRVMERTALEWPLLTES